MKRILIPLTYTRNEGPPISYTHLVRTSYIKKLLKYNLTPVFITVLSTKEMVDDLYSICDGILLMGGLDINPKCYNVENVINATGLAPEPTDEVEIYITKKALNDKKPFFGICRGLQILNVACGGTLHQSVEELKLPTETPHPW